jgi:effector-binding domain-containing protein
VDLTIETKTLPARRYVGVRRLVKHDGIGPACGEILPRLAAWLGAKGVAPQGPPTLLYHGLNRETGECDIEPALFVATPIDGEGDIHAGMTAGGEVLTTTHVGPYSALGQSWEAIFSRAQELKRRVSHSSWEVYVDDPQAVAPANLRTQLFLPIDP